MEQQLRHYGRQQQATAASTAGPKGAAQEGRAGVAAALLPEAILMFRDGISQSQFEAALANEFTAIKEVGGARLARGAGGGGLWVCPPLRGMCVSAGVGGWLCLPVRVGREGGGPARGQGRGAGAEEGGRP